MQNEHTKDAWEPREFHITDVLSVWTDILLSPRGTDAVYEVLNFLTQDNLWTHQIPRVIQEAQPWLLHQHPVIGSPGMQFALAELKEMLNTPAGKSDPEHLVTGWLSKLTSGEYGFACPEMLLLRPIPQEEHEVRDPVEEAQEMKPHAKIISIERIEDIEGEEWKHG